ncbi:hypothetical protein Rsub_07209 [Raphidocelis subcapitata]|uniref:Uncharacterized protein n=1 Tax=Raphidocelis subcapitata TaxID=307507 RepID=A0A2V0PBC2_9CHLO|nr:hypothetical protein Rsub_07209 [Raphidocelis subcapitata]|eukprot:GBF94395.1 hypothetical protein Rsub_07209 [Raphidocelis subcapitata]
MRPAKADVPGLPLFGDAAAASHGRGKAIGAGLPPPGPPRGAAPHAKRPPRALPALSIALHLLSLALIAALALQLRDGDGRRGGGLAGAAGLLASSFGGSGIAGGATAHQVVVAADGASGGGSSGEWCSAEARASGGAVVHRLSRCWAPGRPLDACPRGARGAARPRVLIATVALNNQSFGLIRANESTLANLGPRGIDGFLNMLGQQEYPACRLSLGLLVSSEAFFPSAVEAASRFARSRGLAGATVVFKALDAGVDDQAERHSAAAQRRRRGALARLRNAALAHALGLEDHVFWVDSDITSMPSHTLAALVDSGKDIVTTVTNGWNNILYERNAWQLPRRPSQARGETRFADAFAGGPEPFVPLDSVGGCTTLVAADVHREGALFAPNYVIGAPWGADGFDGIESEGLCHTARFLGRSCWLAAHITTYHQSFWIKPEGENGAPSPGELPSR